MSKPIQKQKLIKSLPWPRVCNHPELPRVHLVRLWIFNEQVTTLDKKPTAQKTLFPLSLFSLFFVTGTVWKLRQELESVSSKVKFLSQIIFISQYNSEGDIILRKELFKINRLEKSSVQWSLKSGRGHKYTSNF